MVTKSLKANMPVDILVHLKEKCATQAAAAKATRMTVNATKPSKSELRVFVHGPCPPRHPQPTTAPRPAGALSYSRRPCVS